MDMKDTKDSIGKDAAVIDRIVLTGKLVVKSPLCIGDGMGEDSKSSDKDIHVQRNKQGKPLIPGTSMCGVLRCFISESLGENKEKMVFGGSDNTDTQSLVQVFDTVLDKYSVAFRDGVAITDHTGVAKEGSKYDYEVVDQGEGVFRLEAVIRQCQSDEKDEIHNAVIQIKEKLEKGIYLGAMTSKGLGLVQLKKAVLNSYDFVDSFEDVKAWFMKPVLLYEDVSDCIEESSDIDAYPAAPFFEGDFELDSTMIIRTENLDIKEERDKHIDKVFLKNSSGQYVVPGSSIKGVLRHQARYILDRVWKYYDYKEREEKIEGFINDLMGYSKDKEHRKKSRFYVYESVLTDAVKEKEITRNRIDRFTGGTIDSSLFTNVPVYQKHTGKSALMIRFNIMPKANDKEIGLALLLFRDLWQGRIAIGGEKGVGRGTLKGVSGKFILKDENDNDKIFVVNNKGEISTDDGNISVLDNYVKALLQEES